MRIPISFFVLFLFFYPSVSTAQNTQIGQLESQLNASPTSERAVALSKAYQEQAHWFEHSPQFSLDSAFFYHKKAIDLLEATQPLPYERLAEVYYNFSVFSSRASEPAKAMLQADKAAFYFEKTDKGSGQLKMLEFDILNQQAMCKLREKPEEALKIIEPAWRLFQDDATLEIQAKLLRSKGLFYDVYLKGESGDMRLSSTTFLQKSIQLYESFHKPETYGDALFINYELLAWYHGGVTEKTDSCDYYFDKMKQLLPILRDPLINYRYYSLRGNALSRRKQYAEAKAQITESLNLCDKYGLKHTNIYRFNQNLMGVIAMKQGQYDAAAAYFKTANDLAMRYNHSNKRIFYQHMAELNEEKSDFAQALFYYKIYSDSVIAERDLVSFEGLGKSELKLNVLTQEKELVQKSAERNLFIAATFIALLLAGSLAFVFLRERRSKAKLAEQNRIIEAQAQALRQLDAAKTRFFANVSHELRTPLTLMLGPLSTTLKSNTLDNKNFTLVSLVKQNTQQLLGLVNEILDLTKLESGKMTVHEEATDAYGFLRRLVATFESYAEQKQVKLIFDFDPDAPRGLMLDKPKVERIFNNLLSNALKFTPNEGSITVKVSHNPSTWQLAVTDTGRGIHPDDLPHVFNRFYQTNQTDMPVEGGTGIGLALAKELAQVLNGNLTVESTFGNGATFTLDLPKREVLGLSQEKIGDIEDIEDVEFGMSDLGALPTSNILNPTSETPSVASSPRNDSHKNGQKTEKATILVVEDNPSLRSYLTLILSDNYNILTAENGQKALDLMMNDELRMMNGEAKTDSSSIIHNSSLPNLIISDIMMPVMDGFQLIEKLKSNPNLQSIPVVMLTARAEMQDRLKALRIGVDDYLTKPFEEEELFARVKNLLNNAQVRKQMQLESLASIEIAEQNAPEIQTPPLSILDREWLADLEKTVQKHIGDYNISVDFIADELHISRAQFYRRVQLLTGLTPNQYLQEIRFNHARQLLEQRKVSSVKAAAAAIGIQKIQYFSEQFKERFGKLPSAYLT
jgi:signal transduction histidine kinase/DNA-binding response OmpR family regulator